MNSESLVALTAEIVSAHVMANHVEVDELPTLIASVQGALSDLGKETVEEAAPEPVVSVRASLKKDHLVCLTCGEKMKMLKRHLNSEHDMAPGEYRAAYNLSADYPMVAPDYAEMRREMAKKIGLGRKPNQKRGRKKKDA